MLPCGMLRCAPVARRKRAQLISREPSLFRSLTLEHLRAVATKESQKLHGVDFRLWPKCDFSECPI